MKMRRGGWTLIEVMVAVGVVGVMLAVALPAIHAAQIFAKRARTLDNLKMVGLAMHNYEATYGVFPMSVVLDPEEKAHGVLHSGFTSMLPFLEETAIYNAYNYDLEPHDASNATAVRTKVNVFLSVENKEAYRTKAGDVLTLNGKGWPGTNEFGPLHFGMNWGGGHPKYGDDFVKENGTERGLFLPISTADGKKRKVTNVRFAGITDGTSLTLAIVEKPSSSGWAVGGFGGSEFDVNDRPAYAGDDAGKRRVFTGGPTPTGPHVLFGDGSARVLQDTIEKNVWYALITRDGAEPIAANQLEPKPK